jgi:hypothetical protein
VLRILACPEEDRGRQRWTLGSIIENIEATNSPVVDRMPITIRREFKRCKTYDMTYEFDTGQSSSTHWIVECFERVEIIRLINLSATIQGHIPSKFSCSSKHGLGEIIDAGLVVHSLLDTH